MERLARDFPERSMRENEKLMDDNLGWAAYIAEIRGEAPGAVDFYEKACEPSCVM